MRNTYLIALSLVTYIGCGTPKRKPQAQETQQVEQPYSHGPMRTDTGVAALAGSWNGTTEVKGYGMATGIVSLDAKGAGHYLVTLAGVSHTGMVHLRFWDGSWLVGQALGQEKRVRGTLHKHTLRLELPFVGTVSLQREQPR